MRWNIRRTMELKKAIATNRDLMQELSKVVKTLLKEHKIDLTNKSYVFVTCPQSLCHSQS